MSKKDDFGINDIILLNNKEYCIIKIYKNYMVVLSNFTPLEIMVGYIQNGEFIKEKNRKIIEEVLLKG